MVSTLQNDLPPIGFNVPSVVELLRTRALRGADHSAYLFLGDETTTVGWSYRQLDQRSRAIAAQLQALNLRGERALLLYPPGLDYLAAFFGCLYAGVIAVPAYPPRNQRNRPRILSIAQDAGAAIALTTSALCPTLKALLAQATDKDRLDWLATDDLDPQLADPQFADRWELETDVDPDQIAMLQYTSGSTGNPKGVMLSHRNLLHNAAVTYQAMAHSADSRFISWLPLYHDMGLIGGILQPLYGGFPCVLMAPATFLQSPYRWLKAISDYRGTTSGAPNFAYELCVQKITPEQIETLDLSSWTVAFNGAEPIRAETLDRFTQKFAPCGFRAEAFYPCYGMAEATLMVTGGCQGARPHSKMISKAKLAANQVVEIAGDQGGRPEDAQVLVGCGQTMPDQQVVIVHPDTLQCCQPQQVGEVWVSGPSVGQGYWQHPEETQSTFQASLADREGSFLRTGDLGFLQDGKLFITGRLKDVIILRGRNLYPQDIEHTVEQSHPGLRLGSGAAFAVTVGQVERLVVVQELDFRRKSDSGKAIRAIRQAISEQHEVQVYGVVLLKPGSIPKTSSGKIQRRACRAAFLRDELQEVSRSLLALTEDEADVEADVFALDRDRLLALNPDLRQDCLLDELQKLVAQVLTLSPTEVEAQDTLNALGLDSLKAFELKRRMEEAFGITLCIADLLGSLSLEQLSQYILSQVLEPNGNAWVRSTIPVADRQSKLPLGLAQERLWFLHQLEPDSPFYTVAIALHLHGVLNASCLEQSLQALIQRHEGLRTQVEEWEGQPIQAIQVQLVPPFRLNLEQDRPPDDFQGWILAEVQQPFDLSQAPLLRGTLRKTSDQGHVLLLTMHHIISDGWSVGLLIQELATLYGAFCQGQFSPLPELPIQYADFAVWQRQWLQTETFRSQLTYWQEKLQGNLPILQLNFDRPRPAIQSFAGRKHPISVSMAIAQSLKTLSQTTGTTLFMTLLAAFDALLYCHTPQDEILIGSPIAGRHHPQTAGIIGFFINTLVFRTDLSSNPSFLDLLVQVRTVALEAYAHQDVPFEKLVEVLQPQRSLSYNPLFQAMFIFQNAEIPTVELPELTFFPQEVDGGTSKFDLKLSLWESADGIAGSLEYKTDLFDAATIATLGAQFEQLLTEVTTQPTLRLHDLAAILTRGDCLLPNPVQTMTHQQKLKFAQRKTISVV